MSLLKTETIWVVTPLLSLRPAVEKTFWLMFVSLLSLKMAPIVSMFDLNKTKWIYLFRALGFIFLIFLFSFSFILLSGRVFDYILISFSLTKLWIFTRSSLLPFTFYTMCSQEVIFSPLSSFSYSSEIAYAASFPNISTIC